MKDNGNTNNTSLVCRVRKVVFHNEENGYCILSAVSDTEEGQFSVCGTMGEVSEGMVLKCQGEWKDHFIYGRQFMVESWERGKDDEVTMLGLGRYRANSRPVYTTWGTFLKCNPDIADKVRYVTEAYLTNVEKDWDSAENYGSELEVSASAEVKVVYYALYDNQKVNLITCSFTTYCNFFVDLDDGDIAYMGEHIDVDTDRYASKSHFLEIWDFDGLGALDFHASGVPTCEEEMRERCLKENPDNASNYNAVDMESDLETALRKALTDAGVEYEDCEFQCTRMFSRSKISGELWL